MKNDKDLLSVSNSILLGSIIISLTIALTAGSGRGAASSPNSDGGDKPAQAAAGEPVKISLKSDVPYLGDKNSKVTVVEYADYQCPFCKKWYDESMSQLKSKYIDNNKIKFIYQDFAFLGPDSDTLAEGSHCAAEQGKFWQYHDYIFTNQGRENSGWGSPSKVKALAASVSGLDQNKFSQCLDSGKYKQEVLDETAAAKNYGVSGTPTVFVNGERVVGAVPFSSLQTVIDKYVK